MFDAMMKPPPQSQSWADTQLSIIKWEILEYQASLDSKCDVALMLTNFGQSIIMAVEDISVESPVLFVFRGKVDGRPSVLLQHATQLSFLLTTVPKTPEQPHRDIGFAAHWAR